MGNNFSGLKKNGGQKKRKASSAVDGDKSDFGFSTPQRPLPQVPARKKVRALFDFKGINDDDLSFKKGDIMEIDDSVSETEDWWLAIHAKSRKKGYIPNNYVVKKDDVSIQSQDWWFEFDRRETDKMLLLPGNPRGTFLVRESSDKLSYVLSVRDIDGGSREPCVKHYKIRKLDDGAGFAISAKKPFDTVVDLIEHYQESSSGLCCCLDKPCPRSPPVVAFRDLEIGRDMVKLTTKLGSGCFGDVCKGTMRKVVEVAVKTLKPGTMTSEAFLNEAKIMHKLNCPKLVRLLAVVSVNEPFWIITELMANGALLDFLRSDQGKKLEFPDLISINEQIAEGMKYLEEVCFVHRDLRAANVLVGESLQVKVADFGLARMLGPEDVYRPDQNAKFPVKWTAPEAIMEQTFSIKSDVWSFGVLLYEVVTYGSIPYPGLSNGEVTSMLLKGRRMDKPASAPDSYYDIMLKCWNKIPEQRPTFESLHDLFDSYDISTERSYKDADNMF